MSSRRSVGDPIDAALDDRKPLDLLARARVPVGIITPSSQRLAGDLAFAPNDGVGSHWQTNLSARDFKDHQLPDPVGPVPKPDEW